MRSGVRVGIASDRGKAQRSAGVIEVGDDALQLGHKVDVLLSHGARVINDQQDIGRVYLFLNEAFEGDEGADLAFVVTKISALGVAIITDLAAADDAITAQRTG